MTVYQAVCKAWLLLLPAGKTFTTSKRLLLIDEAQILFAAGTATDFWANMKALLDGRNPDRNMHVIIFAMLGDRPSGMPATVAHATPVQFSPSHRVDLFDGGSSHGLQLALSSEEYAELWVAFAEHHQFAPALFSTQDDIRTCLFEVTHGHVSLQMTLWLNSWHCFHALIATLHALLRDAYELMCTLDRVRPLYLASNNQRKFSSCEPMRTTQVSTQNNMQVLCAELLQYPSFMVFAR